jgi:aspartate kinase
VASILIGGIMRNDHLALLSVLHAPDRLDVAAHIFEALGREAISAQFAVQCLDRQHQGYLAFCVLRELFERAAQIARQSCAELGGGEVTVHPQVASMAIYGPDFRERSGIAGPMFSALAARGIGILAISTSISTISCIIDLDRADDAEHALRETFILP